MSALIGILIAAAARAGAPVVKSILEKHVGGAAGDIGGTVIDAIASQLGVEPEKLPEVSGPILEDTIRTVEEQTPELVLAYARSQELSNQLMLAEMGKESPFGWMWRPAGMWLMLACVAWYVVFRPLLNVVLASLGSSAQIELGLDMGTFMGIFMAYIGLYMGGNTLIRAVNKGKE